MSTFLTAPSRWMSFPVNVLVVGAGGNGGEVVDALAQFSRAMEALGGMGLEVTVVDDAIVREVNLVRQRFWASDIGQNKAITLVNRYNLNLGLGWQALPLKVEDVFSHDLISTPDLIISCVDLPSVRRWISQYKGFRSHRDVFWLDLGNAQRNGQAVIGVLGNDDYPTVEIHYPELADLADDYTKSCSTAEAIASQDCLINRTVATAGMNILWELLRFNKTDKNGVVIDLQSGMQMPIYFPPVS